MASVSADPLKGIAYLTGINTFSGAGISALTEGAYSFNDVFDFANFNVRLKKMTWTCAQSYTQTDYTLKVPGDPGYDPSTPASYISRVETVSFNYAFVFVATDSSYVSAAGSNVTLTPAPFRQRDVRRSGRRMAWEFNNHTPANIRDNDLAQAGSWNLQTFNASGTKTSDESGDIVANVGNEPSIGPAFADATKWYMSGTGGIVEGILYASDDSIQGYTLFQIIADESGELVGVSSDFPSVTGATLVDLKIGTADPVPSDTNFPSGPAKYRYSGSPISNSVAFELYSL